MSSFQQQFETVIVRFGGEIGIKAAWTRRLYERRLIGNIKAALKHNAVSYDKLVRKFGRVYVKTPQAEIVAGKLSDVLGVASTSPATETSSSLNDILNVSVKLGSLVLKKGQSLAVRCHRVGKHSYTSQEVCRQVGQEVLTSFPNLNLHVDLTQPDQTLHIEVREDRAYLFTDIVKGPGGLPLGTQPKLVCLLKQDISSAVACWMTMKRGCPPILVTFQDNGGATKSMGKVTDASQKLMEWAIGFPRRLYVMRLPDEFLVAVQQRKSDLRDLLRKRFMLGAAQLLAQRWRAEGIVTGDSLGKVASKSLHTFRIEEEAAKHYPVHRPLLGLDSQEIEETARKIGFETVEWERMKEEAATTVVGEGRISLEDIRSIEGEIGADPMVKDCLKSIRVFKV